MTHHGTRAPGPLFAIQTGHLPSERHTSMGQSPCPTHHHHQSHCSHNPHQLPPSPPSHYPPPPKTVKAVLSTNPSPSHPHPRIQDNMSPPKHTIRASRQAKRALFTPPSLHPGTRPPKPLPQPQPVPAPNPHITAVIPLPVHGSRDTRREIPRQPRHRGSVRGSGGPMPALPASDFPSSVSGFSSVSSSVSSSLRFRVSPGLTGFVPR
ncbi:hypothetical protein B0T18DRAFT_198054 [Schizothecium vesticola]|uniref:Uncharacterized protein n=1 Tax=Schizothecium vesticola TaxID=314040 RepID=A0AA40ERI8_9PEZI|nr:hypothetical protein B0T18DRAFT_198054 [Schizothecium vesticola]